MKSGAGRAISTPLDVRRINLFTVKTFLDMPTTPSSFEDSLSSILPGLNGLQLWPALNAIMVSWILLAVVPRWEWTATLSLVVPLAVCVVYASGMLLFALDERNQETDLFSFQGVVKAFQNPNLVFLGWIHYIAFDCLVGRMMVLDSIELGVSTTFHIIVMVPCLFFTLMLGPIGFLLYATVRQLVMRPSHSIGLVSSARKIKED